MSNEPEQFDAIHAFVCASVAACFATIYPRATPEKFRELVARVARPEAAARAPECEARTATQCLARERAEILAFRRARIAEAERLRTFLKDCFCPCCNARYRLRVISYDRACESPASIHCASTDRRNDNPDAADALALSIQAVRAAAEGYHETDTDAR